MRVRVRHVASYAALLVAGLLVAISLARGGFVPGGTDSSAYVAAGAEWHRANLFRADSLRYWAAWPNAAASTLPVGFLAGAIPGTEVAGHPPGFRILIATARFFNPDGAYLIAPLRRAMAGGQRAVVAVGIGRSERRGRENRRGPGREAPALRRDGYLMNSISR